MRSPVKFLLHVVAYIWAMAALAQSGHAASTAEPSSVGAVVALQPLAGTLFFNREQRERMDRVRTRGNKAIDGNPTESVPSVLDGFVKRSDGQSVIWVDGLLRYNVQSDVVRRLQPQDVGGTSEHLKVVASSAVPSALKSPSTKSMPTRRALPISKAAKRK